MTIISIFYATRSPFKRQEIEFVEASSTFRNENGDEERVGDRFKFMVSDVETDEHLEVDLAAMVKHKAVSAYRGLLTPCIVEHAGLILEAHIEKGYPGGL